MTTRLARYEVDPVTSQLRADDDGGCRPTVLEDGGVPGMQGATSVDGTWYVTTSRGRYRLGSVWVGRPGALGASTGTSCPWARRTSPTGRSAPLWSLSEYPGARYVYAMPRAHFR